MDSDTIIRFLTAMGAEESEIIVDEERRWVRCPCIFAPWTHKSGKDSNPSFGVTIRDDVDEGESVASCLTCGRYMYDNSFWHLEELLHRFWMLSGMYPKAAAHVYATGCRSEEHEGITIKIKKDTEESFVPLYPLPNRLLSRHPKVQYMGRSLSSLSVIEYLAIHRGISTHVQNLFGVRCRKDEEIMVFPLTGLDGRVYTMRERACDVTVKKIWTVNAKTTGMTDVVFSKTTQSGAMFGMDVFDIRLGYAVLCEGEIDAMKLYTHGMRNVLAAATNQITAAQCKAIHPYINRIIHVPDADKAGAISVIKLMKYFGTTEVKVDVVDCGLITISEGFSSVTRPAKDAGDLESTEQMYYLLNNLITPEEFLDKYK